MKLFYSLLFLISCLILPSFLYAAAPNGDIVSVSDSAVNEGNTAATTTMTFVVSIDRDANTNTLVFYEAIDNIADNDSAHFDDDYTYASGSIQIPAGQRSGDIDIDILGDDIPEPDETLSLVITNITDDAGTLFYIQNSGIGTIINDDDDGNPILKNIPNQLASKNLPYDLNISSYVINTATSGTTLSYTLIDLDTGDDFNSTNGFIFSETTGILSGTPTDIEDYNLRFTVNDGDGDVSKEFTLSVNYGFCYQYAYKQNDNYFTEYNDGEEYPNLTSTSSDNIVTTLPIITTLYLRYSSSLNITDLNVTVFDINDSQVTNKINSTTITNKNNETFDATIGSETTTSINNIQLGAINNSDHFYINYQLIPSVTILDTPINAKLSFTLDNGTTYSNKRLGPDFPLCSYAADNAYSPINSIFNVVHNDYYDSSSQAATPKYYNIPTQVTNRTGDFKIISLKPEPQEHTLNQVTKATIVSVDIVDVSLYGDAEASCQEESSAITGRVWRIFDENSTSTQFDDDAIDFAITEVVDGLGMVESLGSEPLITTSSEFYKKAGKNLAFRTSYTYNAEDGSILQLDTITEDGETKYNVLNFPDMAKLGECLNNITPSLTDSDRVAQWCNNAGKANASAMNRRELAICMKCIYGYQTKLTCSRDNFSIRPESFKINIKDQDQNNPSSKLDIDHNKYASMPELHLAAEYNYNIEINATSHIGDNASEGYSHTYTNEIMQYTWNPTDPSLVNCQDGNHTVTSKEFHDGSIGVDANTSIPQVGIYKLNILDSKWTGVDGDWTQMAHHYDHDYFIDNGLDCNTNASSTYLKNTIMYNNSSTLNGCNISSTHTNPNTSDVYSDLNITFHPYKFDLNTTTKPMAATIGLGTTPVTGTTSFVYMSNMNTSEEMSYHLNGYVTAQGYYDSNLTNFTDGCYAKAVDLNITKSSINTLNLPFQYKFEARNILDANITTPILGDINDTAGPITIGTTAFHSSIAGSMNSNLNLNFFRETNSSVNPQQIQFSTMSVDCNDPANNCTFNADLVPNKTTHGEINVHTLNSDNNITYLYGRTHAPTYRFKGDTGDAFIYYESFCNGTDKTTTTCGKTLLPNGAGSKSSDDPRWFNNTSHAVAIYGDVGTVSQKGTADTVSVGTLVDALGQTTAPLTYDETKGYPYKTTMENNASRWLIYNKYDSTDQTNEFDVGFVNIGDWTGKKDQSVTSKKKSSAITNRRSMW